MLNRVEKDAIESKPLKIGTLLVNEGFIRKADLDRAIDIQQKEARMAELPLGRLLVKKNLIDRHQLQALLQHPELVREIETFALETGRLEPEELARCIEKKPAHRPLAEALVADGHLTDEDLKVFFEQQLDSLKICELAVETGMVSEFDMTRFLHSRRSPRTIGEILCDLNLITPLDLNAVLSKYRKHLRLGEILLKHELIDPATFDRVLEMHERREEPLGSILRREGILTEDQLFGAFALQYNIPFEKLEGFEYDAEQKASLTKIVDKTFSDHFHVLPLRLEENTLTVVVSDPAALQVVHSLRSKRVDLRIHCVLVTPSTMARLYADLYGVRPLFPAPDMGDDAPSTPRTPLEDITESEPSPPDQNTATTPREPTDAAPEEADIPAGQLLNLILNQAVSSGARTIHIDQGLRRTALKFRIGDSFQEPSESWPEEAFQKMARQVMDVVKEIAGMDVNVRHRPQEGMFRAGLADRAPGQADMDFSVTSCPTLAGESITISRIQLCSPAPDLDALPHSSHVVASLKQVMKHTSGMLLLAAPPGNGRSATLYGMLRHIQGPALKTVTVEDAVSYSMPEAVQIQANPSSGLTSAAMLRAALRLDPDVVLVGDLADSESLTLSLEAARKGILLLEGIWATDAAAAVSQVGALGRPAETAALLKAVLAQRYVRKICPECKQPYAPSPEEWQALFERLPAGLAFYKGTGCPACGFSGYRGRTLLSELLPMSDAIARAIKQHLAENDIRHLVIRSGIKTLIDDGLSKLDQTTLSEIIDSVPPEAAEAHKCIRADARLPAPASNAAPLEGGAFKITLSWPEIPAGDIRRLHSAYEVLMEETGRRSHRSSPALFETFIKTHLSAIRRQYGCSRVAFSVERRAGGVVLLAAPELY